MPIERPESRQSIPSDAKLVFKGKLFDVYQWEQTLFDGTKTTFEKIKRLDTVVVFAVQDDGMIILTEQEQPGGLPFVGAAGGRVEQGEDPLSAVKRELLEETGYEADEYNVWDAQQPVGKIDWAVYTFIAHGARKVAEINLDAGEKIQLKLVTFDELIDIALQENFSEREVVEKFIEAKYDNTKREALRALFTPKV